METPLFGSRRGQNGSVMVIMIVFMFFAATIGAGLAALQLTQAKDIWTNIASMQAYYLAEAGIQDALAQWDQVSTWDSSRHLVRSLNKLDGTPFGNYDVRHLSGTLVSVGKPTQWQDVPCVLQVEVENGKAVVWRQLASPPP